MSQSWTHAICTSCWNEANPFREPFIARTPLQDYRAVKCCFCGMSTEAGIFVRHDPANPILKCGGEHDD